jgi:hypothetical protein
MVYSVLMYSKYDIVYLAILCETYKASSISFNDYYMGFPTLYVISTARISLLSFIYLRKLSTTIILSLIGFSAQVFYASYEI